MPYGVLVFCVALVSIILAVVTNMIGNPLYLMTVAIWLTLFLPANWPWR